jgi:uncharacterized membrane protein
MAVMYGPIQMFVIAFPGNQFKGEIVPAINEAREKGLIRLIDYLFVMKDANGDILSIQGTDLGKREAIKLGAAVGALMGLGAEGLEGAEAGAKIGAEMAADRNFGLDQEDIDSIAEEIPENSSALVMLVEHLWAKSIKEAMRDSGGVFLAQGMLQPEMVVLMGAALAEASKGK